MVSCKVLVTKGNFSLRGVVRLVLLLFISGMRCAVLGRDRGQSGALTCFPTDFCLFLFLRMELVTVTGPKLMLDVAKP